MIFFDIDGTLIDHKRAEYLGVLGFYSKYKEYFDIDKSLFYEEWCKISETHFRKFLDGEVTFSQQRIDRIKDMFSLSGKSISDEEAGEKFKAYVSLYENNLLPYDDVAPCLEMIKQHRIGIISNGDYKQQMIKLGKVSNDNLFEVVITAGEVGVAKPSVDIFKIACERANVEIKDCIYVGDDIESDMISCTRAGMMGVWINRTKESRDFMDFKTIKDLRELKSALSKW